MTNKQNTAYKKVIKILSKNYWTISTLILAVLLITMLLSSGINGATISTKEAGQRVLDFANEQGANAKLLEVQEDGTLYKVILSIPDQQGNMQEVPLYITKDGKQLIPVQNAIPLEA